MISKAKFCRQSSGPYTGGSIQLSYRDIGCRMQLAAAFLLLSGDGESRVVRETNWNEIPDPRLGVVPSLLKSYCLDTPLQEKTAGSRLAKKYHCERSADIVD